MAWRPRRDLTCRATCLVPAFAATASISFSPLACAQSFDLIAPEKMAETSGLAGLLLVLALVFFSTITALLHLAGRKRWTQREAELVDELARLRHQLDRAQVSSPPNRRSPLPGLPPAASRISRAIFPSSQTPRSPAGSSASARGSHQRRRSSSKSSSNVCASAAKPSACRWRALRAVTSKPKAGRSAAARSCAFATFQAIGSN